MSLPPHLQRLFVPRPPLRYLPQVDIDPSERRLPKYSGLAGYLHTLSEGFDADYKGTPSHAQRRQQRVRLQGVCMHVDSH